jgi:hypothetical protein
VYAGVHNAAEEESYRKFYLCRDDAGNLGVRVIEEFVGCAGLTCCCGGRGKSYYSQVIGNSSMPYLNSLARKYGFASSYYGDAHPSLPNYFMLTVGNTVTYSDSFTGTVSANNIVRQLLLAGLSQARMRFNIHASLGLRNTRAF